MAWFFSIFWIDFDDKIFMNTFMNTMIVWNKIFRDLNFLVELESKKICLNRYLSMYIILWQDKNIGNETANETYLHNSVSDEWSCFDVDI